MSSVIRVLPDFLINQIAAGEVIEQPASVVKELVENSIDAGSSKIVVEISGGGLQKIVISDDGGGMSPQDALLCLERHATSKIVQAEDLANVKTMGFRGEALASIASISKMTIQTAQASGVGTQVEVEGGAIHTVKPCARNSGTTIEVRQLFYNVPARRKFQKSPALCSAEILKTLSQLSLAHPEVGFELYENGQQKMHLLKGEGDFLQALEKRAGQVLGDSFLEGAISIEARFEPFAVRGILGGVQNTRPTKALQYAFINQRPVLCPALSYAAKDAFGTRIGHDRFPIYALHVEIPSAFLDVNVHPQKREVRLREEKWIKEQIQAKIQEELFAKERSLTPSLSTAPLSFNLFSPESFFARPQKEEPVFCDEPVFEKPPALTPQAEQASLFIEKKAVPIGIYDQFLWLAADSVRSLSLDLPEEGLLIVDLKAARSRILFEELEGTKKIFQQMLLIPLSLSCTSAEAMELEAHHGRLQEMGFSLQSVGRQAFLMEGIPAVLKEEEALEFVKAVFLEEKGQSWEVKQKRQLASACSRISSLHRGSYEMAEALEIFYALVQTKTPLFCPLGHKTIIQIGRYELQQLFTKKR